MFFIKLTNTENSSVFIVPEQIISMDRVRLAKKKADGTAPLVTAVRLPGHVYHLLETPKEILELLGKFSIHAFDKHGQIDPSRKTRKRKNAGDDF